LAVKFKVTKIGAAAVFLLLLAEKVVYATQNDGRPACADADSVDAGADNCECVQDGIHFCV
jgi:hypothetical protein